MAINQGDNGGGNPSNGKSKFTSLPPAERVDRLHKALMSDEFYSGIITNDFNAFVEEFSQPERMRELHTALSQDEVFSEFVPSRYEDAIEWMGFTTKPEPMGKPSPTTQMQSGRGGVDSGAGSQSGLQSSSQRRITVDDIGVAGVGGTEPEFNYEVDRQAAEEESESLRQQRVNRGVNQINILVNAAGKEGRGLIEKGLSEGLSQREYQKLYDVLEGTQFRDYISGVNPMTDFVSPNAFRQIFADGITAGGSGADFSTVTKRGDFDKLSQQANADAVNQWLSGFDSRMQDKVGERAYRAATEQARATYGEKAGAVINNAERLIAHQSISEDERNAAALVRELNDLVGSGRELSNEEIARAAELDRQIKSAEVELGKMGTLYDPITGQFIPQMRAPEFAAEVSQREEELSEVKDLDLLKDMRRRAYFAYAEYRKKAGDKDFLYEWIPGQDVDVDRMRAAWKEFSALNRVIELNIDPATISREGENLAALRTGFMGSPNLESKRSVVEGVVDAFRRSGLTPTKEQEDRLQKSFGEQIAESIGASTNIMLKMGAEMALTRGMRGALGLNSYANAFRRVLSATRLGAKAPKAVNISSKILGGVFDVGQSAGIYSVAGAGAATGAGEEIAQKIIDLFTKGKAGRIAKLISGSIGEVTAEYIGEYANALAELGIDNLDEAFRETFGRDPESAMDKLLLTLATIAPFAGVSAIGREFTDSVEKYAKSQPASDVQREVLGVIDALKEADAKRKGGAAAEVGATAATAAPEVAAKTLEEQKADIERRRQEELNKINQRIEKLKQKEDRRVKTETYRTLDNNDNPVEVEIITNADGSRVLRARQINEDGSVEPMAYATERINNKAQATLTNEKLIEGYIGNEGNTLQRTNIDENPDQIYIDKINAKYDAELAALEQGGTTATPEAAPEVGTLETTPEAAPTPTTAPALADVESTAKALSGKTAGLIKEPTIEEVVADLQKGNSVEFTYEKKSDVPLELRDKISRWGEVGGKKFVAVRISEIEANYLLSKNNPQAISELYHAAKAKPEGERTAQESSLIESVENLLTPKIETDATKEQGAAPLLVGDRPQVSEEVRGQDTQGGEVTGEGEVKTKEGEPTQEEVGTIASKAGVKAKNLRDLYRINRDLFGQNRIKAFASAIVMDRMIGAMAARAGVTKAEMYGKLDFRKGNFNEILQTPNVVFQGTFNGQDASFITLPEGISIVDGWYSPIEKRLRETKADKQSANKWLTSGLIGKGDEAIYTGVKGWLESKNPQEQVSKQDILDWMKENRVEIVEVVKQDVGEDRLIGREEAEDMFDMDYEVYGIDSNGVESLIESKEDLSKFEKFALDSDFPTAEPTKFSQYQLEGEKENYKEVLVTLPTETSKDISRRKELAAIDSRRPLTQKEQEEYTSLQQKTKGNQSTFKSSHFNEPNILVHLRMNTRTDADGNKVLFLEEIQSDWGQQGKKEGFKEEETKEERLRREMFDEPNLGVISAPFVTDTNAWVKLGLKMALREAVSQGAAKIAWTTGEQQFDRWGSEKISWKKEGDKWKFDVKEQVAGTAFEGVNIDERALSESNVTIKDKENLREVLRRNLTREKTETELNKLTDRIWDRMQKEDSGTSLPRKEGMEAFYDRQVRDVAKALVRELTGQKVEVGKVEININDSFPTPKRNEDGFYYVGENLFSSKKEAEEYIQDNLGDLENEFENFSTQQSIDISPALKAQVQKGMPLFQRSMDGAKGAMQAMADGSFVIYAITDPNVSTPLHELAHVFEHYLTDAEKAAVQSWAKTKGWTTETSEAFARGFEKYLADGIAPTAQLQKIFDKFKQWLVDIYNGVVGSEIDIELNDSMRDIYARMVGDTDVAVETEPVQEGKVAKIVEGLRSDPNVTEVHVSGNDIVYSKKDKNGNPRYYEKIGGGRSNQLSKTDFEFKREIAMDNATSITEAGIPLEGEPAFLEGEDQTSLNVLDNNLVFTTTGTFPESTNEILGEEKSESETLTDEEVESAVSGDGIPLTSVSALSPKEKSEALKKANERLEASKKRLKESWNKYRGISMSTGIIITPQSVKQNVDTMFEVFRDISLYAKDWALQKAFQGVEFSKINFMEFKRENRFLFTNAGARKAVGGRFFDEAGGSMAELAFDDGVKMALDLNYDGVQSPDEMTELQRASRGEVGSVTDVILEQFNRDSKPVSAPYRERILNAFRALNSALDYNANVKKSVIKLRDMIAKTGVPNFSISEFFEKLQFAFQPGSKIDLKFKKFKKDVYGNISSIQKEYLDLIILYDNVISLEDAIAERRTKISEFDNDLVSNHDFEAKNLRKTLNDYAAGRNVPKKVKEKIDAYLASTGQTESEFKSKIRSIEGKRVLDGKISPNYQHPYNLKKDSAQAQIEVVRKKLKEKYGDAEGEQIFNDLRSRADKYFDFNRSLLKDRLDAGQISIHIYEELKDRKYVPRLWEEVDLDNELSGNPLYDVMKISGDGNAGGYVSVKMPVLEKKKSLVGGSRVTQKAIVYSDTLMHMNVAMTIRAIENHRLMQFVVNNVIPSSDAMVDFLLSQESKAKGRPLTSSEEREIRSQSQNVYELKRIGTNKDGSPKFEPPLNGFVTFVFSDGDVTRAFASRKVGSTDFMGEFKMKSGRRNREALRLISNIMGTSLLKMSAVGLNVAFFIKQMTSMDVIHQISVLPGVKFVPSSYVRRVVGAVGLVSGKVYDRAIYSSRVAFANYFNGTMPKEKASKFERMVEDAIAHGLDFGTGILGHSNVADFETGAKSDKLDLAFNKALDFLQAGGRDSELATRIVSWNILTASEMKKMKKKLKRDLTPEEISSIKRNAAKEVSNALNYSVRGPILDVVDSFSPFFAATVNAQKAHLRYLPGKLGRIAGGEPMSAKRKAEYMANVGQIIFFSTLSSLWMFAKDDEDERDGVIPIGASDTRDAYVIPLFVTTDKDGKRVRSAWKISLDKTAGFYQLIGKAIAQSIYYGDEDNWSTTGRRPAYPVTAKDFAVSAFQTIPAVGSVPPLLSSLFSLLGNYDTYRFQDIYKGNKDARSDLQATQHTRAVFRKMARFVDPATEAMLGINVSAQQLESAVGKVIALNNPFSQAVTWGFAQFMPEDMRGKGEKELSDLSKAMLGNMYIEARRARQDIPAGKIGAAMANIESLRTVDDVMSEVRALSASELNANYSDIAASISKAASTTTRMDAGYPTSRQVLDLIEADGVDYAAGARVISAYQSGKSDVVRDLMSLPAGRFGPNDSFFKSLVGPNNEREDIAYEIKDDREAKLEDNYVPSDYYFDELVNMGLSKDAAFELSESLSKLKAAESK